MYPPEVPSVNPSTAEKRIFTRLRDGLPNEWAVLHSVGMAGHPSKPWAEIDFVLIGPPGVFCLEVKGGRVERLDGMWTFTNRFGQETRKAQGPFEQVGSATAAMARYLMGSMPRLRDAPIGYGVMFAGIEFTVAGPDIEAAVTYDIRDAQKPIARFIDRLSEYWTARITRQHGRPTRSLTAATTASILAQLRSDFDLRPSLRMRIGTIAEDLLRLTEAQYRILDGLKDNATALIRGGAGTGKTFLAVEEARRAATLGKRVLLLCFTRALAEELMAAVSDFAAITASHLHGFMASVIAQAGLQDQIPAADESDVFTLFQPLVTLESLPRIGLNHAFDLVIVDEGQDLLQGGYLEVIDHLLKDGLAGGNWRWFYDPRQNVFDAVDPKGMRRILDLHPAQYRLTVNCRNTEPVAVAVALLSGTHCDETLVVQGPEVETFWYVDGPDQTRKVSRHVGRLLSQGLRPDQLVILSPRRLVNSCLASGFLHLPYSVADREPGASTNSVRFRTIQSYKGLESDVVVLVDIDHLAGGDAASTLYVGASRARTQLAVFLAEGARSEYVDRATEFGRQLSTGTSTSSWPPNGEPILRQPRFTRSRSSE